MSDPNTALDRLRRANLLPPTGTPDPAEIEAMVRECERRVAVELGGGDDRSSDFLHPGKAPRRRSFRPAVAVAVTFVLVMAAIGVVALVNGSVFLKDDVADTSAPATTEAPMTTTTATPTTTTTMRVFNGVAYQDNLVYYSDAEHELMTSVFVPEVGSGPWPVVVVYSEFALGAQERGLAMDIARRGAVVFAPRWVDEVPPDQTAAEYLTGGMWDRAACAVGYAEARAGDFGGDASRVTVVGDAGGEHPAAWVALGLADTAACPEPLVSLPSGLVAGESQWLFPEDKFDPAFTGSDSPAVDTIDRLFNPDRWTVAEDLSVFLWTTAWPLNSNVIEDPPGEDSWVWSRDPDGDIVADLADIGAFDDGVITFSDNTRLMQLRMLRAGIDVDYYEAPDTGNGYKLDVTGLERLIEFVVGR